MQSVFGAGYLKMKDSHDKQYVTLPATHDELIHRLALPSGLNFAQAKKRAKQIKQAQAGV